MDPYLCLSVPSGSTSRYKHCSYDCFPLIHASCIIFKSAYSKFNPSINKCLCFKDHADKSATEVLQFWRKHR
jgi:hypothetical protein